MKKYIAAIALALAATAAYACVTHTTILPDGRMVTCTTCCYGPNNCTTTCF